MTGRIDRQECATLRQRNRKKLGGYIKRASQRGESSLHGQY